MTDIVQIAGKVKFPIVLDPSSWIFDNRKIEWQDYLQEKVTIDDVIENRKDERAGAAMPRMIEVKVKYDKATWLTDSFVIPVEPFLKNAEPLEEATHVRFENRSGEQHPLLPIDVFKAGVFGFSKNGKILQEDGPLQFCNLEDYKEAPITGITKIIIESN